MWWLAATPKNSITRKGQENVYNVYQGRDGVSLGSLWRRALFAWYFGDFKLLISDNVTASSKILFRRLIQDRIQTDRAVSPSRSRSLSGRERRALDLVAGRLHRQRLAAVLATTAVPATSIIYATR